MKEHEKMSYLKLTLQSETCLILSYLILSYLKHASNNVAAIGPHAGQNPRRPRDTLQMSQSNDTPSQNIQLEAFDGL